VSNDIRTFNAGDRVIFSYQEPDKRAINDLDPLFNPRTVPIIEERYMRVRKFMGVIVGFTGVDREFVIVRPATDEKLTKTVHFTDIVQILTRVKKE
jgi:hypothetical protein